MLDARARRRPGRHDPPVVEQARSRSDCVRPGTSARSACRAGRWPTSRCGGTRRRPSTRAADSNSVPPPRPCAERRPTSRTRARLMRSSASSFDRNGGCTCSTGRSCRRRWRATSPSGPSTRTTTSVGTKRPRRDGSDRACARSSIRRRDGAPWRAASPRAATAPARRRSRRAAADRSGCRSATLISPGSSIVSTTGHRPFDLDARRAASASAQSTTATTSRSSVERSAGPARTARRAAAGARRRARARRRRAGESGRARTARRHRGTGTEARMPSSTPSAVVAFELGLGPQLDAMAQASAWRRPSPRRA